MDVKFLAIVILGSLLLICLIGCFAPRSFDPILDTYANEEASVEARGLQYDTDSSGADVTLATHDAHKWADPSVLDYFVSLLPSLSSFVGGFSAKGFHHSSNRSHAKGGHRSRQKGMQKSANSLAGRRMPQGNMFNKVMSLDAQMARGALEAFAVVAPTLRIGDVVDLYRLTGLTHLDPESPLEAVRVRGMIFSRVRGSPYWRYIASVGEGANLDSMRVSPLGPMQDPLPGSGSDDPMGQAYQAKWDLMMLSNDGDETKSPLWSSPFPRQDSLLIWVWAQSGGKGRLVLQSGRVYDFDGRFMSVGSGY